MSQNYILNRFADIKNHADDIEQRLDDGDFTQDTALKDNEHILQQCRKYGLSYHLIDEEYNLDVELNGNCWCYRPQLGFD